MRDKILDLLQRKGDLPPFPQILLELQKLINDPNCNVDDVNRLIKSDLVLMGKLIRLSNCVFFGGGREKANNLEEAIVRLGIKMVLDLCYCVEVPKAFGKPQAFNQAQFWQHSLAVGYLSRMLANKLILSNILKNEPNTIDESFLSGLMHDIGILVFDYLIPEEFNKFLIAKDISNSDQPMETLEKLSFGIDHQELGTAFLQQWWPRVPTMVVEAVALHHRDHIKEGKNITLTHVVSAANKLANEHGICQPLMTQYQEELSEDFIHKTGIENSELALFIDQTKIGLLAFEDIFDS
ncbi:MAG: HD-like signal output (HDOD) protein [Nitrospinales bacterium]|jgi:HD-like signal output (HDOD) protein